MRENKIINKKLEFTRNCLFKLLLFCAMSVNNKKKMQVEQFYFCNDNRFLHLQKYYLLKISINTG